MVDFADAIGAAAIYLFSNNKVETNTMASDSMNILLADVLDICSKVLSNTNNSRLFFDIYVQVLHQFDTVAIRSQL
jgi:hypothetical protein